MEKETQKRPEDPGRPPFPAVMEPGGIPPRQSGHFQGSRGKCNFRHATGRSRQARSTIAYSNGNTRSPGEIEEVRAETARDFDLQATHDAASGRRDREPIGWTLQSSRRN